MVTYHIGGLLRCCIVELERHGDLAEGDGQKELTCPMCTAVIVRGDDGTWRFDAERSARTVRER